MYKTILDFDMSDTKTPHGPQTQTCGDNYLSLLSEHISLTKINNNHFKEIRDSFPKYVEEKPNKSDMSIFPDFLTKIRINEWL